MQKLLKVIFRGTALVLLLAFLAGMAKAAPYAEMVIDARTGEVLRSRNADTRLYPASLTKMMTLYIAFEAIRLGEITLDTPVTVAAKAAAEPPSKLGLRTGQKIALRYLIRAAAVKSANDAATAIGIAIEGSEAAFARRMNRTAKAMGMTRTTFRNANGLTREGHLSTARDMAILGRHIFFDYPQYYNLFSRRETDAGMKTVHNTNRKFLNAYRGADGIKTGYTSKAGFNLVASAQRGEKRVIGVIFGGRSTAARNQRMAELLDLGFSRSPAHADVHPPPFPLNIDGGTITGSRAVVSSIRPRPRPDVPAEVQLALGTRSRDDADQSGAVATAPRPVRRDDGLEVVTRMSTSSSERHWAISLGRYGTQVEAEKLLLKTALKEIGTLDNALRRVLPASGRYDASFVGLSKLEAERACFRLLSRDTPCLVIRPPT